VLEIRNVILCESSAVRFWHSLWCLPCKVQKDTLEMLTFSVFCFKLLAILIYADSYSAQTPRIMSAKFA
jgi:hypothetical protein